MKVARAYTATSDEFQDLAQEILLQGWRSLPKFALPAAAALPLCLVTPASSKLAASAGESS
jgi:DNA-directed RNA polymerase specialized sigma24 family protein